VYEYFRNSLLKQIMYPNGSTAQNEYDQANRLRLIQNRQNAALVSSFEYQYDENGNRTQQVETNGGAAETTTYDYDLTDRLEGVTYPDKTTTYTYDAVGNRLSEEERNAGGDLITDKTFAYDDRHRLREITDNLDATKSITYGYDANGNQIAKTQDGVATTFRFDIRNQLTTVTRDSAALGNYGYDYQGLRIFKQSPASTLRYVYDDQSVLLQTDNPGATVAKYEWGADRLLSLNHAVEGRQFYLFDGLGSVSNLTRPDGALQASYQYDAWGKSRGGMGDSSNPFGFTGQELDDDTGLYYFKARFYDVDVGRFLSEDPAEGDFANPPSLHRYLYAFGNPTRFSDPEGLAAFEVHQIGKLRYELSHYQLDYYANPQRRPERGSVVLPAIGKGGEETIRVEAPSQAMVYLLTRYGSKEAAIKALDAMRASNLSTFAITILEAGDFDKNGQLIQDKVFGDFIKQVGSWALGIDQLKQELLANVEGARAGYFRDVSLAYNVAYDYSAAAAFAFAERESSDTFFIGGIQRQASLLGQGLYKTAPSDFTLTYGGSLLLETISTASLATGVYNLGRLGFNAVRLARVAPSRGAARWTETTTLWQRRVLQRGDVDWELVRPAGAPLAGKTNLEAAQAGWSPVRPKPGSKRGFEDVVLHHLNQDPRGGVAELWRSTHGKVPHGMDPPGNWRKANPEWAEAWRREQAAYWRWRTGEYNPPPTDRLRLPGDK
jgi:RHS repeat-associated protein